MGLLCLGEPLSWAETVAHSEHVRSHGVAQFVQLYRAHKDRRDEGFKCGDEIEYMVVKFDHSSRKVRLSLRTSTEVLPKLQEAEESGQKNLPSIWRPEFASYQVEGTPGQPYSSSNNLLNNSSKDSDELQFDFLLQIEKNMKNRRAEVQALLEADEAVLTISAFPRAGTWDFCYPRSFVETDLNELIGSLFMPDQAINHGHPRFMSGSINICQRRGRPSNIQLPIYRDLATPTPFLESFYESANIDHAHLTETQLEKFRALAEMRELLYRKPNSVYMDSIGFGGGCCCLQVTFQGRDIDEARHLYDQLVPLTPILMALTAGSPAFRGYLTDLDTRWKVVSGANDDRTEAEVTGNDPNVRRIPKSRFDSVDLYIGEGNERYNDIEVVIDEQYYEQLVAEGVDRALARHIAHLFIRDPIVLFKEKINQDDTKDTDHFESTNWQTMRFKPPPGIHSPGIGWRVEFRPMELQITDKENAAFTIFIVLMTRLILAFNLDLLIPISKVEENMKEAQKRAAVTESKFWFRTNLALPQSVLKQFTSNQNSSSKTQFNQFSIDDIINGTGNFPGLIPLINLYLDSMSISSSTRSALSHYLELIAKRARGELPTPAQIIRDFATSHADYKRDSVANDSTCYDLLVELVKMGNKEAGQ